MSKLNIEFLQAGGVPLTNDLMAVLQDAYNTYEVLGDMAGDKTILQGCEANGSSIAPGVVAINGEVLPFEGGLLTSTVYVHLEEYYETFQDQTSKILVRRKTVKFGNSSTVYNWSDFVRLDTLKSLQIKVNNSATQIQLNAALDRIDLLELKTAPIINGGVVWAFGKPVAEIPAGWKEAVDIRGKTIVGCDPDDPTFSTLGANIGAKTHTLSKAELPNINGTIETITGNGYGSNGNGLLTVLSQFAAYILGSNNGQYMHKNVKINFGADQPHNNIQPSRIANFIEPNFI